MQRDVHSPRELSSGLEDAEGELRRGHVAGSARIVRASRSLDEAHAVGSGGGRLPAKHRRHRDTRECWQDGDNAPGLVGSLFWTLRKGDTWVLGNESAFIFTDCWRKTLVREAYMLDQPATRSRKWRDVIKTAARRRITGEPILLDLYVAQRDGAELGISSDELGGNLYSVSMGQCPLIVRKSVYFGSQKDVLLRIASPLRELKRGIGGKDLWEILKKAVYGPGWVFQRFEGRPGGEQREIILQIDGDIYFRHLAPGSTLRIDPRHAYAWDESVSYRLVRFGHVADRLLRGGVPFQIEFEGPGRVWLSNMSFAEGYLGQIFTPSHWVFRAHEALQNLVGFLNPARWL